MKVLNSEHIRQADQFTIQNEPIASIDLMERASNRITEWIIGHCDTKKLFTVIAGPGNNGGDGLAVARILTEKNIRCKVEIPQISEKYSNDFRENLKRLEKSKKVHIHFFKEIKEFPQIGNNEIIIDALFGTGLSRSLTGISAEVVQKINMMENQVISIDIPSGMMAENIHEEKSGPAIKADYTLTFQCPKPGFFYPENYPFLGEWFVLDIGLKEDFIESVDSKIFYTTNADIQYRLKSRKKFDHKGTFGHGLLISGSQGKTGATVLSAKAALKTGIGLLTCHLPADSNVVLQTAVSEAMTSVDENNIFIANIPELHPYNAIAVGPGIGTEKVTERMLRNLLSSCSVPLIIDADAINIIGKNSDMIDLIPKNSILTPHFKEFERIAGKSENHVERIQKQRDFARLHNLNIILKGAHTCMAFPDGQCWFNSTGNPGMATGGSGDVLTGILLSLLAQGYNPEDATIISVYLHGLAGDIAALKTGYESLMASDITDNISLAFKEIRNN